MLQVRARPLFSALLLRTSALPPLVSLSVCSLSPPAAVVPALSYASRELFRPLLLPHSGKETIEAPVTNSDLNGDLTTRSSVVIVDGVTIFLLESGWNACVNLRFPLYLEGYNVSSMQQAYKLFASQVSSNSPSTVHFSCLGFILTALGSGSRRGPI